jgi:glycosyltransferase involved in cell wall biosynthesis
LFDMLQTVWRKRSSYAVAQIDVFSGPAFLWAEIVCYVLRRLGKPYVLTLHGGNLPLFARSRPRRVRNLLVSARVVTAPSRFLQQQMMPYKDDLYLLPNPLDLSGYEFRWRERPEARLIWLRAFDAIYNPTLAVRVLALLAPEFPDARLIMVGPDKGGGSMAATRELAEQLGIGERLELPGGIPKTQVPEWLNRGDIFFNTTNIDNTPISVMEAMACGLCIVSTDVGGMPYLLEQGHDALLVPPDDADAMTTALRRILTEAELAGQLSRNARRKAETFDWGIVLPQWEELLEKVAKHDKVNTRVS